MSEIERMDALKEIIAHLQTLEYNWNGYGANRFQPEHLEFVRQVLAKLNHFPEVFPTAADSVQLEYETPSRDYLEFEIFSDRTIKMFSLNHDGTEINKWVEVDEMNQEIAQFFEEGKP